MSLDLKLTRCNTLSQLFITVENSPNKLSSFQNELAPSRNLFLQATLWRKSPSDRKKIPKKVPSPDARGSKTLLRNCFTHFPTTLPKYFHNILPNSESMTKELLVELVKIVLVTLLVESIYYFCDWVPLCFILLNNNWNYL